jgi:hypothetical protein
MLFVSVVQYAVGRQYRIGLSLWELSRKHFLLPILTRMTHSWKSAIAPTTENPHPHPTPRFVPPEWVNNLYRRTFLDVHDVQSAQEDAEYQWWDALVRQLLLKCFGMAEEILAAASFEPLYKILSEPTPEETRGSVLVNASEATGWAGLLAATFAPTLRNKWYMLFAIFLVAWGLTHDFIVTRALYDPSMGTLLRLRAVLHEFKTHLMKAIDVLALS